MGGSPPTCVGIRLPRRAYVLVPTSSPAVMYASPIDLKDWVSLPQTTSYVGCGPPSVDS